MATPCLNRIGELSISVDSVLFYIGVGRFTILGGPRFRILGGAKGGQIPRGT